ncbi:hypothetical protein D3C81_1343600 [compost metagenome]
MTAGFFVIVPTAKIAACGWLMIGVPIILPKAPILVNVNVPSCVSSGFNLFARDRCARSLTLLLKPTKLN